jgi:hypothetical protein
VPPGFEIRRHEFERNLMRHPLQVEHLRKFMTELGRETSGPGRIYLPGGATALLYGWRPMTVDVDLKADPEPSRFFESIARLKDSLQINVKLASPSDFIPELPDWRSRSIFIERNGQLDFYHLDPYSQALSKTSRGHPRDLADINAMVAAGLIAKDRVLGHFNAIKPLLIRYPAIDPASFLRAVESFAASPTP